MRLGLLLLVGCGMGAAEGGGGDNLPVSGSGPYFKIQDLEGNTPLEEPFVLFDPTADLTGPTATALEGGGFRLWYARNAAEIWRVDLADLASPAGAPARVLGADQAWEAGAVAAPSVTRLADGSLVLAYEAGGQVGLARSGDGDTFTKEAAPLGTGREPTAIEVDGELVVYVADGGAIRRLGGGVVLAASPDATAFDAMEVADPTAAIGVTATGRTWIALFYVGTAADGATTAIGFAGSDDGATFVRSPRGRAILEPRVPSEIGPAPVLLPDRAVLFYSEKKAGKWALAAAVSTAP